MNNQRRKIIRECYQNLLTAVADLNDCLSEEKKAYDNVADSDVNEDMKDAMSDIIDYLDEVINSTNEAIGELSSLDFL